MMILSAHSFTRLVFSFLAVLFAFTPLTVSSQALEEIVVTAERRVQTLQEVPISVGVFTRDEIDLQGYKNLDDLSKFSPSVQISNEVQEQNIAIRSFSTRGNSLTLQSAAPVFLDGVHFGRMSMVKTAFMDPERVEILKGPQPLHFGMNATAGAFNIQSARPTDTWEGNASAEFGNFGASEFTGAISGPINDQLSFRLAGIYEQNDGPAFNRYAPNSRLGWFHHIGGRLSTMWRPVEGLSVFSKIERSRQRNGSDVRLGCLSGATMSGFGDDFLRGDDQSLRGEFGDHVSVLADPPIGIGVPAGIIGPELIPEGGSKCFKGNLAFGAGGQPYIAPPLRAGTDQNSRSAIDGAVDSRDLLAAFYSADGNPDLPGVGGADHGGTRGFTGKDWIDTWNGLLAINYEIGDGLVVTSETGWAKLDRLGARDSRHSPFVNSFQPKEENYDQFSQLLRLDSPAAGLNLGAVNMEYMGQLFYQEAGLNFWNGNSEGASERRAMRFNNGWENSKWYAASWNLTFNMVDDQVSLSVGGRFTDIKKNVRIGGWGAAHIFDEVPCADPTDGNYIDANTDGDNDPETNFLNDGDRDPGTCPIDEDYTMVDVNLTTPTFARRTNGNLPDVDERIRIDTPQILIAGADTTNLWTRRRWSRRGGVPLNYRGGGVPAVGFTAPHHKNNIPEPWNELQKADDYNHQIVLSFTPNALEREHTFYGKYVEAFKGPVTDTGQGGLPLTFEELAFEPEFVTGYEFGSKGLMLDNRFRYDLTLFRNDFDDLQTIGAAIIGNVQDQTSVSLNAGKQRVDGLEFSFQYGATENLTLSAGGSLLDAKFITFDGDGCSTDETAAAAIEVAANPGNYTAEEVTEANDFLGDLEPDILATLPSRSEVPDLYYANEICRLVDTPEFAAGESNVGGAGTINRGGVVPQDAPDWRFVLGANYTQAITDDIEAFVDVKGTISDEFRTGRAAQPAATVFWDRGGDVNVTLGVNSIDGAWRISGYFRNIFERRPSYHPEIDLIQSGLIWDNINGSGFFQYGFRLQYNYQ
jgi:outer membrane receptor protein involved in Fe transport